MAQAKSAPKILVVDDEPAQRTFLSEFLGESGFLASTAGSAKEALAKIPELAPRLVITDLSMPEMDGLELIRKARASHPEIDFIIMTAHATVESAVSALKAGADDYLLKPLELDEVLIRVKKLLANRETEKRAERLERENQELRPKVKPAGRGPAMQKLIGELTHVSSSDATVLLLGETGVGKEVMARFVHENSERARGPFVAVNCSAIPENLVESEFFGFEKGAFTGADRRNAGFFERADGGTLFLDEIGELDLKLQPKILRALEERTVRRVAGANDIPVNVRLLAATHRDLKSLVADGKFREDLYYRLNVVQVRIPPLRERKEDIEELVKAFVERYSAKGKARVKLIEAEYLSKLAAYDFPGNIRELANAVERSLIFQREGTLTADLLPKEIQERSGGFGSSSSPGSKPAVAAAAGASAASGGKLADLLAEFERRVITDTLNELGGDIDRAAVRLDVARSTLYSKMSKYGLRS